MPKKPAKSRASKLSKKEDTSIEPSLAGGNVTAKRRGGRPLRLTQAIISQLCGYLAQGLYLESAASLAGLRGPQVSDWLRLGRRDHDAKKDSIYAMFSEAVERTLAKIQQQQLGALQVYQRIAEGWSPTCAACKAKQAPCGAHPENLAQAVKIAQWILTHRFPAHWNSSTVRHELGQGDEPRVGAEPPTPQPSAVGLVVFLPPRKPSV